MEFEDKIKNFAVRIEKLKNTINTEEATKTSLIMPFFQILGYDVFNPNEFTPEYVADVGIKKGEKVDYAIILNDEVCLLIEAKSVKEKLEKHDSQLFRYFGTSRAKFAILTNGINYKFYTDLEKTNVMDTTPFLDLDISDLSDSDIQEIKKFQKENFDVESIVNNASDLKYLGQIKKVLKEEFNNPSDDFLKLILNKDIYDGVKTQSVIEKYRPILKKSLNSYINELINNRLQSAIQNNNDDEEINTQPTDNAVDNSIITTAEEIESYYIVKSILSEFCAPNKITYKDTASYFGILYDNKVTKWICRIYLKESVKFIIIHENEKDVRYDLKNIHDIYNIRKKLINRLNAFTNTDKEKNTQKLKM